jgi:hypothetical protein
MPIVTTCGECGKSYRVDDKFAGKKAKCKACGAAMVVPTPPPPPPVAKTSDDDFDFGALADMEGSAKVDASAPMAMTAPPPAAAKEPKSSAPAALGVPTRTVKPKAKAPKFQLLSGANAGVFFLFCAGGVLIFLGIREYNQVSHGSKKPQLISCMELGRDGPGDNKWVDLVKFGYSPGKYLTAQSAIYIPAYATDSDYGKRYSLAIGLGSKAKIPPPPPDPVFVLVKTSRSLENLEIARLESQLEGMVINDIDPLTQTDIAQIQPAYPKTNFSKCWIVEEGREQGSAIKYLICLSSGGLCILLAVALLLLGS